MFYRNQVTLAGTMGAEIEVRSTGNGQRVANLRLATTESWRDKTSGEKREKTEWHRVTVWGDNNIKYLEKFTRKGTHLFIVGKLLTRKWAAADGSDRFSTEIVVDMASGEITIIGGYAESGERSTQQEPANNARESFSADLDDEIPF